MRDKREIVPAAAASDGVALASACAVASCGKTARAIHRDKVRDFIVRRV